MSRVELKSKKIFIDKKPVQILSGAIHYFRVHPEQWRDRLEKLALCGMNCVETYMCWNLHEPEEGRFDFSGILDFERFIRTSQELGLYCIVRPGPYICAEWDNGGFPAWLMNKPGIEFRRMNKPYLDAVKNYFDVILPKLVALQYDNGGNIIMTQVENEYGSYGHDREYLGALREKMIRDGVTVPLFTADGASEFYMANGMLPGTAAMLTGGSRVSLGFDMLQKLRPEDPPFYMEFWDGWFDHWHSTAHRTRSADEVADEFEDAIRPGGNFNFYMFHGGTNFGFTAGANGGPGTAYTPDTTSYDYDAPLSESGDPTEKYFAIQKVVKRYFPEAKTGTPKIAPKKAYPKVDFSGSVRLFDSLDAIGGHIRSVSPKTMEACGQSFGFIHYRTRIEEPQDCVITLWDVRDRARLFIDGKPHFTSYRNDESFNSPLVRVPEGGVTVDLLVENFGRINYGVMTGRDFKGVVGAVAASGCSRFYWDIWTLPMDNLEKLSFGKFDSSPGIPAFHRGEFEISETPCDTFLAFPGSCGAVWINGFNLGRYWSVGPSKTLYVPAPVLRKGKNEIIVFETDALSRCGVKFTDAPQL